MKIGIDATNIGSGGGVTHLKEIINNYDYDSFKDKIEMLTIFSSQKILDQLEDYDFIRKVTFENLNKSLLHRVYFQFFKYDSEIIKHCDILYSLTGDYIGKFKPLVGMSRNMLLYERDIWIDIKYPKEIMRFWLNYKKQKRCFKESKGIIFISKYAENFITKILPLENKSKSTIYHGLSPRFIAKVNKQKNIREYDFKNPFKLLYISTVHVYKNHINLVNAIAILRKNGYPVVLSLIGGVIFKPEGSKLLKAIIDVDPKKEFIFFHGNIEYEKIDSHYRNSDGIVFASSCENMPNILLESMASGVPIACSNKDPMPEFLRKGGFYFDAKSVPSIVENLITFLESPEDREIKAKISLERSKEFSWEKTSNETFNYLIQIYKNNIQS
jgi:glycosyltransferase involved in cell wall biosynthesis